MKYNLGKSCGNTVLYVDENHREKGIAEKLVEACISEAIPWTF